MPCKQHRHRSIIHFPITIPVLFATSGDALPNFTAAAASTRPIQTPTISQTTTYTATKISSTTLTTISPVLHMFPHILSLITTMTVTTYEPWPGLAAFSWENALDSSWSTTVLESVVSSVTWVERRRYLVDTDTDMERGTMSTQKEVVEGEEEKRVKREEGKQEETTITSFVMTSENTWVVYPVPAEATGGVFLATGVGVVVGCGGCSLPAPSADTTGMGGAEAAELQDAICKTSNLTTGCQGQQCIWKPPSPFHNGTTLSAADTWPTAGRGGTFWCLHMHPYHYSDPFLRMGRACWGTYLRYRQLNAPCLVGDVGMACLPCVQGGEGEVPDESWDAVFWEGEE
ncbi:hypothetical protein QBC45DRAFT_464877 [Copromyces sp. CBS 386.78]|nr:hypothetical protein QBC45DRAFT_464877 [Copromyces sp. CBS 386.78]